MRATRHALGVIQPPPCSSGEGEPAPLLPWSVETGTHACHSRSNADTICSFAPVACACVLLTKISAIIHCPLLVTWRTRVRAVGLLKRQNTKEASTRKYSSPLNFQFGSPLKGGQQGSSSESWPSWRWEPRKMLSSILHLCTVASAMVGGPTEILKTPPQTAPFVWLLSRPSGESLTRTRITQRATGNEKIDRTLRPFCNARVAPHKRPCYNTANRMRPCAPARAVRAPPPRRHLPVS